MDQKTLEKFLNEALDTNKANIDDATIKEMCFDLYMMNNCRLMLKKKEYNIKNLYKTEPNEYGKEIRVSVGMDQIKKVDNMYLKHRKSFDDSIAKLGLTANQRKDLEYKMQKIKPVIDDGNSHWS